MIDWIKRNKLTTLLLLLVLFLLIKNYFSVVRPLTTRMEVSQGGFAPEDVVSQKMIGIPRPVPVDQFAPTESKNRLVVKESSMSMVVADVRQTSDQIIEQAKSAGGYMVTSSLTNPEEAPFATVIVRLPSDKLRPSLDYFRSLGIKVTSENILGTDVTDQYVDIQARLSTLEKTKAKFEEIMAKAAQVQDILNVQRELVSLQDQIDSLKGQQRYLEQTAKLAKITVYLSTDEFALPYAPSDHFRPEVIFKQAIRSLVSNLRNLAGMAIWVFVYGIIWIPLVVIAFLVWRRKKRINSF